MIGWTEGVGILDDGGISKYGMGMEICRVLAAKIQLKKK